MIWQLEVDTAIKKKVEDIVNCPVVFSNPNIVATKEKYPTVSITLIDQKENDNLKNHNSRVITKSSVSASFKDAPSYYDFHYQIDFWAKRTTDINILTGQWIISTPPKGTINLVGSEGENYLAHMKLLYYNNLDIVKGEDTTFRRCYTYKISIPVDSGRTVERPLALDIGVTKTQL